MTALSNRVTLVTGSTRGIGWQTACTFAQRGATVVLNGRNQEVLAVRAAELSERFGVEAIGLAGDAAEPDDVRSVYRGVFERYGRLDVMVNNAGILDDALVGMIGDAALRRSFDVNSLGAIHHLQGAARLMRRHRSGSIVNVTSIVGRVGNQGQTVYSATKAALIGLTMSAAKELAPAGIRVNAVAPGFIDTDMTRGLPNPIQRQRIASIGMGRIGTPEDVALSIAFLAGDDSRYVTGQVLGVDGGMLI